MNKFLNVHGNKIIIVILLFIYLKSCSNGSDIVSMKKDIKREIKLEGLRVEKRMIQSTDRKILDVNRQKEIDKEISKLEK
jgi:hypothetical protein